MSDLISSPSQTQSAVSSEAFEALIDLLATDGIDENPSPLPGVRARTQSNVTLRDPSGKLDFDKIRLMFAVQNHHVSTAPEHLGEEKNRAQSPTVPNEDGDSDDEHRWHRSRSLTVPSCPRSMSPKSTEHPITGHRRSSTFGNQPWTVIHENGAGAKVDDVALAIQPLSFDELNAALVDAHEEVRSLRQQYDELQALVSKRLGTEKRDPAKISPNTMDTEKVTTRNDNGRVGGYPAQLIAALPPAPLPSDVPTEIVNLSENEAKRALSALARSLNLSLSTLGPMATTSSHAMPASLLQGLSFPYSTRQHDVASIARAVKFLATVDELVWRRALAPSGPRTLLPVYSEENVVALLARLELWERAVRRSSRA